MSNWVPGGGFDEFAFVNNFDPMTCNINELVTYWKSYTLSEPIWNDVRRRIYEQGIEDALWIAYDKGYITSDDEAYLTEKIKEWNKK